MKSAKSQSSLILITLILTAILSWFLYFRSAPQNDTVDINQFPRTIGTWSSIDIPLTKDEFEILETKNAFVRLYTNSIDQSKIYLYLVYSQTNRKIAHPPEICYTGNGMSILEDTHETIPIEYKNMVIDANRLHLSKDGYNQAAYYWFKIGDHFTSSYWKEQIFIAIDSMLGKTPSSALIRISADVRKGDWKNTEKILKNFTSLVTPDIFKYLP